MLIFAADLEEVEEVCCSCMDGYQVFVRSGVGIGDGGDGEVVGALLWWGVSGGVEGGAVWGGNRLP